MGQIGPLGDEIKQFKAPVRAKRLVSHSKWKNYF